MPLIDRPTTMSTNLWTTTASTNNYTWSNFQSVASNESYRTSRISVENNASKQANTPGRGAYCDMELIKVVCGKKFHQRLARKDVPLGDLPKAYDAFCYENRVALTSIANALEDRDEYVMFEPMNSRLFSKSLVKRFTHKALKVMGVKGLKLKPCKRDEYSGYACANISDADIKAFSE